MSLLQSVRTWFSPRRRVAAAALFGWVVVVIVASGPEARDDLWIGITRLEELMIIGSLLLALLGLFLLVWLRPLDREDARKMAPRSRWASFVTVALAIGLALVLDLGDFRQTDDQSVVDGGAVPDAPAGAETVSTLSLADRVSPREMVVLGFVLAAVALALWLSRTSAWMPATDNQADEDPAESDLRAAVSTATDVLFETDDPRRAVLAAYASLEASLADRGHAREPSETATEHLARVLVSVPVLAAPSVRLGELYELARFSEHSISRTDQQEAAVALDRARRGLAAQTRVER